MRIILNIAVLALIALLAAPPVALADELPEMPTGMELYIMIMAPGTAKEPDLAALGGKVLRTGEDRRLIAVPPGAADVLEKHERVAALQPLWMGDRTEASHTRIAAAQSMDSPPVTVLEEDKPFWSRTYAYDHSGNVKSAGDDNFGYDTAGRIVKGTVIGQTETYGYDAFGNLTTIGSAGATRTLNVNPANNHLRAANGTDLHDSVGNMLALPGSTTAYTYDALGMLVQLGPTGTSQTKRMIYTADDERIAVQTVDGDTRYVVRGFDGKVLREWNHSPVAVEWVRDYVYADGQLIAGDRQVPKGHPGLRHFHTDHLGSVRVISRGDKRLISQHDYLPFGTEVTSTIQEDTRFGYRPPDPMKFTSHERDYLGAFNVDNDEYLDYMHARYYSAGWGRFLSVDPTWESTDLGSPQSWNRYAYVRNNPINATDPDGRNALAVAGRLIITGARLCASSAPCAQRALAAGINLTGLGMSLNERFDENKAKWEEERQKELPENPDDLLDKGYEETSHSDAAAAGHRTFENPETGDKLRFDKGKEGKPGHEGRDHYHRENPNATGKKDQYLDAGGKPVPRGSDASHLYPKSWWDRVKEAVRK